MQDIVKTIENMVINGQFQALLVTIGCVMAVVKAAETVFKVIAGIAAALALIYFFDPSFYSSISISSSVFSIALLVFRLL